MAGRIPGSKIGGSKISAALLLLLAFSLPALLGQGCPQLGAPPIENVPIGQESPDATGNTPPSITFVNPLTDVAAEVGDTVQISWIDDDPDNNASITLLLDPDREYGNGNEIVILPVRLEDQDGNQDVFVLNTSNLSPASYRIIARLYDGVNPEQLVTADGRLLLFGSGLLPGNVGPSIVVTQPTINYGVSQGDIVDIEFCGADPDDDGGDPGTTPDIVLLLDTDDDPTNDLDLTGDDAETILADACNTGYFPVEIDGVYVISCFKDNDCAERQIPVLDENGNQEKDENGDPIFTTALATLPYQLVMDLGTIPPTDSGEPYRIRATMWDHVNQPVHSYAPGTISITVLGSGTIDLGNVGRTISGTKFYGFNEGDRAGSLGADLGDLDGDGTEDFAIVARYGQGFYSTNTGMAAVILGLPDKQKFGAEVPLNSVGTVYRGALISMDNYRNDIVRQDNTVSTEGIASISRIGDVTGDGLSDILFGMPYVSLFYDDHDDDPQDKDGLCYNDSRPNPLSDNVGDDMGEYDSAEGSYGDDSTSYICSNDYDLLRVTPLSSGYVVLLASENNFTSSVWRLGDAGQSEPFRVTQGARFRGAWYPRNIHDYSLTEQPNILDPDNMFGRTVASMPPMTDTSLTISPRYGSTMLVSAPNGFDERGMVVLTPQYPFTTAAPSASIPWYVPVGSTARTIVFPSETYISGESIGDHLGYAGPAGDYNLDGSRDIAMGAPGADRDGITDAGIVYILFGRPDFPSSASRMALDLGELNMPRMEIHGSRDYDMFGTMQTIVGDINQDGLPDIGFSSGYADGPGGVDSGFIGIVLGGKRLTGENIFSVDQLATSQLPGVKIYGTQPNGHAGMTINNAGDFNGDGTDDLLIVAPDELRTLNGIERRGVAYLIFGGMHMMGNPSFNLSQVGTTDLPGIIFVSPYDTGSADEAPVDWASGAGDINSDGFDDIMVGVSEADYVNPLEPSQRRNDAGEMYLIYGSNTGSNTIQP